MAERYFKEPYEFVPPYRSTLWCRLFEPLIPRTLKNQHLVKRCHFVGLDRLRSLIADGTGLLLAPNHSRLADTTSMAMLSIQVRKYFYYAASAHLFRQNRRDRWLMNRLGAFSIYREGADRESLKECSRIIGEAERPLVVFPEGTWFRQNDRLGPLQDGVGLMVRQAAKKHDRPVAVLPIAIKYWYLNDPRPAFDKALTGLEKDLTWKPQNDLDYVARIEKLSDAFLTLKEIEFLGAPQQGGLTDRMNSFIHEVAVQIESHWRTVARGNHDLERIRAVRQKLAKMLTEVGDDAATEAKIRRDLDALLLCEVVRMHSQDYLRERPSFERIGEAIQRLEESRSDRDVPLAPMGVVVTVGQPLMVENYNREKEDRRGPDPLMED
ncbi:MAG TPA: 1-acyl-sn-glycerol-3-phosphate acyltransferase, partial [Pirellulales bacterium]